MIQFNLLPDVKLAYIKAQRVKKLTISISVLVSSVMFAIFVVLFLIVNVVQKQYMSSLNADIKASTTKIRKTPDLSKVLTVQNQLATLPGLHSQKPSASRLYDYLSQVTPSNVTLSDVTVDFAAGTMKLSGEGPSLDAINTFVDTLKFTTYTTDKDSTQKKPFSDVVLASFSRKPTTATYDITVTYDKTIFDITSNAKLTVPTKVTTRSVTEQPTALFKQAPTSEDQ